MLAPRSRSAARQRQKRGPETALIGEGMSILIGILLYILCVAFFCGLTGLNRLDGPELRARRLHELDGSESVVPAPEIEAAG